jgi:cob(I)alamin adenosyltransferase
VTDGSGRAGAERLSPGFDSAVATGKGDDGTTGLLYGGERIAKDDPRAEAYGTIDEAVAALGLARAELALKQELDVVPPGLTGIADLILRLQRELFVAAAELATTPRAWDRLQDGTTRVSAAMVEGLDSTLRDLESHIEMPREFVVPGESRTSAAIELARTTVRRAERRAVTLGREGRIPGPHLLPYLNRLADLLWVLARAVEQAESRRAPPSRPGRRRNPGARTEES